MTLHPSIQLILCVIGNPVAGNPMQFAVERAFAEMGIDWKFVSLDVRVDRFEDAMRGADAMGFAAMAIAAPFETQAASLVSELSPSARRAGWVDSVVRISGDGQEGQVTFRGGNQFGRAVADLVSQLDEVPDNIVVLGQGPRSRAIAAATAERGLRTMMFTPEDETIDFEALNSGCAGENEILALTDLAALEGSCVFVRGDDEMRQLSSVPAPVALIENPVLARVEIALSEHECASQAFPESRLITGLDLLVQSLLNYIEDWSQVELARFEHQGSQEPSVLANASPDVRLIREACEEYFEL